MTDSAARMKWALTREAFDRLLLSFDDDREAAGEKYLSLRRNLVRFFEGRGCSLAEDYADESINRIAKRIYEGEEIQDINHYCYGVARFVWLEALKEKDKEEKVVNELPTFQVINYEEDENTTKLDCLQNCLRKLPLESRELITKYYQGEKREKIETRQKLADGLGIPMQALRSRAVRLREKLEACMVSCLRKKGISTA
jgi:DNA-directed RNA polymerase specialized sigma24 family protein